MSRGVRQSLLAAAGCLVLGLCLGFCLVGSCLVLGAGPATAKSFRWANDGDVRSLDPYAGQEVFLRSFDFNIYEPLVRRGRDLAIEPSLAVSWSQTEPERWRFSLRPNVLFQDGTPFTADDVVFSFDRVRAPGSRLAGFVGAIRAVRKIDALTVEFVTNGPDPILPDELTDWAIMSKAWCEAHDAAQPADSAHGEESYATEHADGTGPFLVKEREPDVKTVLAPNPRWWDKREDNLDEVDFLPLRDDAQRVKKFLSGALDMIYAVPPEAIDLIARTRGLRIVQGPELRTIFLGFDQARDELVDSSVKGRNPFKDKRVREAFYRAIDEAAIAGQVMRGLATPTALLVAPGVNGFDPALDKRFPYDPALARQLLAAAGYGKGFEIGLDCPNDRYVNDEAICGVVADMLGKVGIKVHLVVQSRAKFFAKILPPARQTSFYLMGWTPTTYDAQNVLINLAATPDAAFHLGDANVGGYSNPALDSLIAASQSQTDRAKRLAVLRDALELLKNDFAYIPLHQQDVVWAAREGVELVQRADNTFPLRYVRVK